MNRPLFYIISGLILFSLQGVMMAQKATVSEEQITMKTYPFSDPDPVPSPGRIYPYFYFNGYTNTPVTKQWKMVVLENKYIKVYVCPDIGGKIWGAIEKSTGNEFLYLNSVVKFRDVAMRGAWTSGGLEYNFGDIGHIPTCSTPVDYKTRENADGSVSCSVGAIDLPSGTRWNIEIIVRPDEAYFETRTTWYNNTSVPVTYYHWMNAAAKSSGNLEFIYPGNNYIGHGDESAEWPVIDGRDLSFYENNNFGSYKSYHVINSYSDYFGGYWHDDDFGFGHWSSYDDKPGKKLWIWGLSRQGMIWESLLTDNDGQYIEFQAGKLFNQAAESSSLTPFKHREFAPHDADEMKEIWFPLKGTEGMVAASGFGVLNLERDNANTRIILGALKPIDDDLRIIVDGELLKSERIILSPLELHETVIDIAAESNFEIILGDHKLVYRSGGTIVDRPVEPYPGFDRGSAYGIYVKSLELEKQRRYSEALDSYLSVIEEDPGFMPALSRIALGYYRQMDYGSAKEYINKALSIDTYDGEANYYLGIICSKLGDFINAKSGFSIAMSSAGYRSAAAAEMARLFFREGDYRNTLLYCEEALRFSQGNIDALETMAMAYRKTGESEMAGMLLEVMGEQDETSHFIRFESFLLDTGAESLENFKFYIRSELPYQTYLDLAVKYYNMGCMDEALRILKIAPSQPVVNLWLAFLDDKSRDVHLSNALGGDPAFVFPHRAETAELLTSLMKDEDHWLLKYYLGLIYWNMGRTEDAALLFAECGSEPGFAPFYLARAAMPGMAESRLSDLKRAEELAPRDWRPSLALSEWYLEHDEPLYAVNTIEPFVELFPEQSAIGICYARSLNAAGSYSKSVEFLESYMVLPFEGATVTRDVYHEATMRASFYWLEKNNHETSLEYIEKAKQWPENLGAGRPYNVDERLEDFMIGYLLSISGENNNAEEAYKRVADYTRPTGDEENSALLLQLIALRQAGKEEEAIQLIEKMRTAYPANLYIRWAEMIYNKEYDLADKLRAEISGINNNSTPYEKVIADKNYKLIIDLKGIIGL